MSMFGMVFPDPSRQVRVGILLGVVAHEVAEEPRNMSEVWLQAIDSIGGEAAGR